MSNESPLKPPATTGLNLPPWVILAVIVAFLGYSWWQNYQTQTKSLKENPPSSYAREDHYDHAEILDPPDSDVALGHTATENLRSGEVINGNVPSPPEPDTGTKLSDSRSSDNHPSIRAPNENRLNDSRTNPDAPSDRRRSSGPLSNIRANPSQGTQADPVKPTVSDRQRPTSKSETSEKSDTADFQIKNQTIRDLDGRVVYKGTIDLKPTLDRIARGEANRHRNDGATFENRENRLPRKPAGYYREYVNPTPGEYGPGPQRIIIGKKDEVWYTPDHYKTFKQIK
ncbi:MAG: ribonuclease domain-containing protein [Schlesneria sp.]